MVIIMALQHFYSRVPAKVSMFNRADGFDTFACSDLLDEETIVSDFACVYNCKPNKDEVSLIRNEEIPPVYFHYQGKSGRFVQSCMSFLKLDYTGERTSYLVHSLAMDEDEQKEILFSQDNNILNPALFVHNLDGFDITSFESFANDEYPVLKYTAVKSKGTAEFVKENDRDMIKRLIYASLTIACGKGKPVYISVGSSIEDCSLKVLDFLNTFMQIFPFHIRVKLPFVTYTPDAVKYSDFKIKGIVDSFADIPASKGIVLHFKQRISLGLEDNLVMSEKFVVDFFYELLGNDQLRREFLSYVQSVYEKMPELAKTTMKNIKELVLLFCECSGLYNENDILPDDDSVQEFITVYEKYRLALSDEFRANAMTCLKRFPLAHAQIPSKTFSKITKIYPTETIASKKNIMSVMLDLIHTDAMRAKLFNFLKANYADESEIIKHQITENLCRVYYGGFLRPQILEFFDEIFADESEENRDMIFEKILLTVRTDAIRKQIFDFINKYYQSFAKSQKEKLFMTFAEVSGDGNSLAEEFSELINSHIKEDTDSQADFNEKFCKAVEKEQKRREHPLLNLICSGKYDYLYDVISRKVFGEWQSRAIFGHFIASIFNGGLLSGAENTFKVLSSNSNIPDEVVDKLFDSILLKLDEEKKTLKLTTLIDIENNALSVLGKDYRGVKKLTESLYPLISSKISQAFFAENGLDMLKTYAENHPEIKEIPEYTPVNKYYEMEKALKGGDIKGFFFTAVTVTEGKLYSAMMPVLKKALGDITSEKDISLSFALDISKIFISDDEYDFLKAFDTAKTSFGMIGGEDADEFNLSAKSIEAIVKVTDTLLSVVPEDRNDELRTKLQYSSSLISDFVNMYKKQGEKWLGDKKKTDFANLNPILKETMLQSEKQSSGSWISKIFKK